MLQVKCPVSFAVPKYPVGSRVVVFHVYRTSDQVDQDYGYIMGIEWGMDGQVSVYHFAPDSEDSIYYPIQPVSEKEIQLVGSGRSGRVMCSV